tara:strand:+ start:223 stop:1857 length:1635 start_codon:yes stop_codon:yes gene_type:complete
LACSLWYSSSNANEVCPSGTVGLCDPDVFTTIVETIVETSTNDGQGTLTTTETTLTTTVDTVTNEDSGDLLAEGSDFVSTGKEGDMDSDWGGEGPASMPKGTGCGALGIDKCAEITGSGNTTSNNGVTGMGSTFVQTIDISDLNVNDGGQVTYSIEIDKQDKEDSIYFHITGNNGSVENFSGTDILSASGVNSGYGQYTGSFNFGSNLTSLIVEIGGRDINLAIGPLFDNVSVNVLYNVISQIILQTISTVEQYVYTNGDATQEEIDIATDIFEHNDIVEQPTGEFDFEPIEESTEDTSYESVEMELDMPDFNTDFDMPDFDMDFNIPEFDMPDINMADIEMEMELDMNTQPPTAPAQPEPDLPPVMNNNTDPEPEQDTVAAVEPVEEKIEVASIEAEPKPEVEAEPEPEPEPVSEPEEKSEQQVKEQPKEEPEKEIKVVENKEPVAKVQKKLTKQKAGSKIVKNMSDSNRYDSTNQLKTLMIMNVIADNKSFFVSNNQFKDIEGFFTSEVLPDSNIPDNNVAAYLMYVDDGGTMNKLIDLQYK